MPASRPAANASTVVAARPAASITAKSPARVIPRLQPKYDEAAGPCSPHRRPRSVRPVATAPTYMKTPRALSHSTTAATAANTRTKATAPIATAAAWAASHSPARCTQPSHSPGCHGVSGPTIPRPCPPGPPPPRNVRPHWSRNASRPRTSHFSTRIGKSSRRVWSHAWRTASTGDGGAAGAAVVAAMAPPLERSLHLPSVHILIHFFPLLVGANAPRLHVTL